MFWIGILFLRNNVELGGVVVVIVWVMYGLVIDVLMFSLNLILCFIC